LISIKADDGEARQARAMTRSTTPFRIAVIEDDAPLLGALAFALEAEGWATATFTEPAEALARIGPADCLVVDYALPQMDGLTLIARLRAQGVTAPAILITARPDERCRRRADAAGVPIVEKPLAPGQLQQQIKAALGASGR
jgi:two-component system, LuxR family, response regulator FixJ